MSGEASHAGASLDDSFVLDLRERIRVVWTTDEKKLLNRLAKIFNMHGDRLLMRCGNQTCPDNSIRLHVDATQPTGAVLRCGCTDRVFSPSC